MSTFLNYTFQSFNFRNKQDARPFYDLVSNIAAEEFGHVELVAKTINTMLTGATPTTTSNGRGPGSPLKALKDVGNPHHFLVGRPGCAAAELAGCAPWNGDYVFSSGDLVEDLDPRLLSSRRARGTGSSRSTRWSSIPRRGRSPVSCLSVAECTEVAYARAIELYTGANLMAMFPAPRIPTEKIPECKPHIKRGEHLKLYRFSPE